MKIRNIIILSVISICLYLILINIFSVVDINNISNNSKFETPSYGGMEEKLDLGDSVGIQITRVRWFGKIYEEGDSKIIYIFDKIRLPMEEGGRNYLNSHLVFLSALFLIIIFLLPSKKIQQREQKEFREFQYQ